MKTISMSVPEMDKYTYRAYVDDALDTIKDIRIISEESVAHITRTHTGYTYTCGPVSIYGDDYEVAEESLIMKRSGQCIGCISVAGCTAEVDVEEVDI
ncbi:MAG: hypothetical protein WC096_00465 [Sphaerochaetaceae bacterium]